MNDLLSSAQKTPTSPTILAYLGFSSSALAGHGKGTGPAATPSPGSRSWRRLLSGQGFGGGGDAVAKSPAPSLELT